MKTESDRQYLSFGGRLIVLAVGLGLLVWLLGSSWGEESKKAAAVGVALSALASLLAGRIIARSEGKGQGERINAALLWVGGRFCLAAIASLMVILFGMFDLKALLLGVASSHLIFLGVEMPYALRLSGPLQSGSGDRGRK